MAGIEGIVVTAFEVTGNDEYLNVGTATTDANGQFTISGLYFGKQYVFRFEDPTESQATQYTGGSDLSGATPITLSSETQSGNTITSEPAAKITGAILNAMAAPLEGIKVTAFELQDDETYRNVGSVYTQADGTYEIKNLRFGKEYAVRFEDPDGDYLTSYFSPAGLAWTLEEAPSLRITVSELPFGITTLPPASKITGTIKG